MIKQDGFPYAFDPSACAGCGGRCCTGESGNIFVSPAEIAALSALLKVDENTFRQTYLEKRGYKFSLKERIVGLSHDCIFYDREAGGAPCTRRVRRSAAPFRSGIITRPAWTSSSASARG
jgi:Fe-S-cluster containining protein